MSEYLFFILCAGIAAAVGWYYGQQQGSARADELTFRAWRSGVTQGVRQSRDLMHRRNN